MKIVLCHYCKSPAKLVTGEAIYPHRSDLFKKNFYQCKPCDAYVGCHPKTDNPLGRLANASLHRRRVWAHAAFDPLWKKGVYTRSQAYERLAQELGIPKEECHIGMFDEETCDRARVAAEKIWRSSKNEH